MVWRNYQPRHTELHMVADFLPDTQKFLVYYILQINLYIFPADLNTLCTYGMTAHNLTPLPFYVCFFGSTHITEGQQNVSYNGKTVNSVSSFWNYYLFPTFCHLLEYHSYFPNSEQRKVQANVQNDHTNRLGFSILALVFNQTVWFGSW